MKEYTLFTEIMEYTREVINSKDPNLCIVYDTGCKVWGWRMEFIKEPLSYYVSSRRYKLLFEELIALRGNIDTGEHSKEAEEQIQRAESWLEIALAHKVKHKNRVF